MDYKERARERFAEFKSIYNYDELNSFFWEQKFLLEEEFKTIPQNETRRKNDLLSLIDKISNNVTHDPLLKKRENHGCEIAIVSEMCWNGECGKGIYMTTLGYNPIFSRLASYEYKTNLEDWLKTDEFLVVRNEIPKTVKTVYILKFDKSEDLAIKIKERHPNVEVVIVYN
jgi:hypothetical protein